MTLLLLAARAPGAPPPEESWAAVAEARIAAGEYAPHPDADGLRVANRAQGLHARFGAVGAAVRPRSGTEEVRIALSAWGREGALETADPAPPEEGPCLSGGAVDAFGDCLRRVDYARPGLTEWWENRPDGLEHGFTVPAPPDGDGPLVFDLAITGADVDLRGDAARLLPAEGRALRYAGLAAWDEAGHALTARMEPGDHGLRLVVDDTGAFGAITVDPLLTTAAWSIEGDQAECRLGYVVASAGDVNGDGYGDVAVSSAHYDVTAPGEGRVYVFSGSASGLSTTADWTAESGQTDAYFGWGPAGAGDVNGDGYADLVVGAPQHDNGSSNEGRAYVYHGSATGLDTTAAWVAELDVAGAYFGAMVGSAGDVNGDGYGDVVVGAYHYSNVIPFEGQVRAYYGTASGLPATEDWSEGGGVGSAYFGWSVGGAGDVNGDGYSDVVVGAYGHSDGSSEEGRAAIYLGNGQVEAGIGVSRTPQAWQVGTSRPIAPGPQASGNAFDVGMTARGPWGRARTGVQVEVEPLGTRFDGSGLLTYAYTDSGLSDTAYHWQTRVVVDPTEGRSQGWGPWVYGGRPGDANGAHMVTDIETWYADADGDGYGDPAVTAATAVAGNVANGDADAGVFPGGTEVCDAADADEDCDGLSDSVDPSVSGLVAYYVDTDGDGYGDGTPVFLCEPPDGTVADGTDCDDGDAGISPSAAEVCDPADVDEDCDGLAEDADPSVSGQTTYHADADGDGYGGVTTVASCDGAPAGYLADGSDCDDADAAFHPGAAEDCADPNHYNCDGSVGYADLDADGFAACTECDDGVAAVNPGAVEVCNGVDDDCEGTIDVGAVDAGI